MGDGIINDFDHDLTVKLDQKTGWFGSKWTEIEISGSITNAIDEENEDETVYFDGEKEVQITLNLKRWSSWQHKYITETETYNRTVNFEDGSASINIDDNDNDKFDEHHWDFDSCQVTVWCN